MISHSKDLKLILAVALPLMGTFLAQKGMQLIDTIMLSWLGPDALAAGALAWALFAIIMLFCLGTLSAVGVQIARARGSEQLDDVHTHLKHGILLALLLSIPSVLLIWYLPPLLIYVGGDESVVVKTTQFLRSLVWGFPGFLLFFVFRELVSAFAMNRIIVLIASLSIPLTFFLNYLLMYGKGGLPKLGITGIGYAGALVMWFMCLSLWAYTKIAPNIHQYLMPNTKSHLNWKNILITAKIGIPSGFLFILDAGMFSTATLLMSHFGINVLAAHSIAFQCVTIAYAVPFGLSMAVALQVSFAMGKQDLPRAKIIAMLGLLIGLFLVSIIAAIFIFFPDALINIFMEKDSALDPKMRQFAILMLIVAAIFQCFDALQAIISGALRGMKDTLIPMIFCVFCYWIIGVGCSYYLAFKTQLGPIGIWYGLTIGLFMAGTLLLMRFLSKKLP